MGIQKGLEGAILVDLPGESGLEEELLEVARLVQGRGVCDVVMDFSRVTILNSACLAVLLRLRNHLQKFGGRLVLWNIGMAAKSILAVTGLTEVFEIDGGTPDALAALQGETGRA